MGITRAQQRDEASPLIATVAPVGVHRRVGLVEFDEADTGCETCPDLVALEACHSGGVVDQGPGIESGRSASCARCAHAIRRELFDIEPARLGDAGQAESDERNQRNAEGGSTDSSVRCSHGDTLPISPLRILGEFQNRGEDTRDDERSPFVQSRCSSRISIRESFQTPSDGEISRSAS